jgi:hypothetical protein
MLGFRNLVGMIWAIRQVDGVEEVIRNRKGAFRVP